MGTNRLCLENGDCFAYMSPHTNTLRWGQVIEEPSEPYFLMCRTYSEISPEGVDGLVDTTQATMFRVDKWAFGFAREHGWPSTIDQFYALSRTRRQTTTAATSS